jgi:hypothetical protein
MSDELATALVLIVTAFIAIAAGFAWWVNRPRRTHHESMPRIQPLFAAEAVGAVAGGVDELDDGSPTSASAGQVPSREGADAMPAADLPRSFDRASRAPETPNRMASGWESAAAMAQRSVQQAASQHRVGTEHMHGAGSPTAWAGGGIRQESAQAMPRRVPMQPQADRRVDRHAERHVERFADRQPERFVPGMGSRPSRASEWTTGRSPGPAFPSPVAAPGWNDGESVRFSVPTDGTLQFLPGRLEIMAGQDRGREIRFVRLPNTEPEITFGRNEGTPYRHVQLRDGTVSRLHARMRLYDGRWTLTNLSLTNPVTHNGRVLGEGEEQPLEQDDRIEMGEVAFRFRSR